MACFPLSSLHKAAFNLLTPLHVALFPYLYIVYSTVSEFIHVGLGFFEVGGAVRTNKTFSSSAKDPM